MPRALLTAVAGCASLVDHAVADAISADVWNAHYGHPARGGMGGMDHGGH